MTITPPSPRKDLGERTAEFAANVRSWIPKIPRTLSTQEDMKQLVRSSGSVAANYIEANEAISAKDKKLRMMICRKEAKESELWLKLLHVELQPAVEAQRTSLRQEARELTLIFNAIIQKYFR